MIYMYKIRLYKFVIICYPDLALQRRGAHEAGHVPAQDRHPAPDQSPARRGKDGPAPGAVPASTGRVPGTARTGTATETESGTGIGTETAIGTGTGTERATGTGTKRGTGRSAGGKRKRRRNIGNDRRRERRKVSHPSRTNILVVSRDMYNYILTFDIFMHDSVQLCMTGSKPNKRSGGHFIKCYVSVFH